jgi:transcriptional accessory protein Tex/SPT6
MYEQIESCAKELNIEISSLFHSFKNVRDLIKLLEEKNLLGKQVIKTILKELKRTARDPRGNFVFPRYADGIYRVSDLKVAYEQRGL